MRPRGEDYGARRWRRCGLPWQPLAGITFTVDYLMARRPIAAPRVMRDDEVLPMNSFSLITMCTCTDRCAAPRGSFSRCSHLLLLPVTHHSSLFLSLSLFFYFSFFFFFFFYDRGTSFRCFSYSVISSPLCRLQRLGFCGTFMFNIFVLPQKLYLFFFFLLF